MSDKEEAFAQIKTRKNKQVHMVTLPEAVMHYTLV